MTTGAPFVLVHGFADSAATWDPLVPLLAAHGPVQRYELPGHGQRAGDPPRLLTRDAAVAELAGRIGALDGPVTVVGHSLGGYLALTLAIRHPALVSALGLISTGPGFRDAAARQRWNDYMRRIAAKNRLPERVAALGVQPDSFVIDGVGSIGVPVVHVLDADDSRYLAGADYLQRVLPDGRLVTIAGCGHHPQRTRPDLVAEAIVTLRRAAGDAGAADAV